MSRMRKIPRHALNNAIEPALLVIAITVCAGGIWRACTPRMTLRDVDRLIQKELPVGSSKAQVYEVLNSHKIRAWGYNVGPDPYLGEPNPERKRYIQARIYVNGTSLLNPDSNIDIYLYFDEQQNLSDYRLAQTYDSF
jgi:hypothetical protein